jgi:hypothetical protein
MTLDVPCVGETMAVVTPANAESLRQAHECLLGFGVQNRTRQPTLPSSAT